jgi:hypothetical protein
MPKYIIRIPSMFTNNYLYVLDAIHDSVDAGEVESSAKRFDSMTEAEIFALTHNLGRYRIEPVSEPLRTVWPKPLEDYPTHDLGGEEG